MNRVYGIIFVLSIAGGAAWGYINNLTGIGILASLTAGGFIGSSISALLFTYLFLTRKTETPQGQEQPEEESEDARRLDP